MAGGKPEHEPRGAERLEPRLRYLVRGRFSVIRQCALLRMRHPGFSLPLSVSIVSSDLTPTSLTPPLNSDPHDNDYRH
jgi:hypothetical protein